MFYRRRNVCLVSDVARDMHKTHGGELSLILESWKISFMRSLYISFRQSVFELR